MPCVLATVTLIQPSATKISSALVMQSTPASKVWEFPGRRCLSCVNRILTRAPLRCSSLNSCVHRRYSLLRGARLIPILAGVEDPWWSQPECCHGAAGALGVTALSGGRVGLRRPHAHPLSRDLGRRRRQGHATGGVARDGGVREGWEGTRDWHLALLQAPPERHPRDRDDQARGQPGAGTVLRTPRAARAHPTRPPRRAPTSAPSLIARAFFYRPLPRSTTSVWASPAPTPPTTRRTWPRWA
jgi:hypothetical protein